MKTELLGWAESRGWAVEWAPLGVLVAVREDLERRLAAGQLDAGFAAATLAFDFAQAEARGPEWRVLVVVMPRPAHIVSFVVEGLTVEALVPPTYQRYRQTFEDVRRELEDEVLRGERVETLKVPLKSVAARVGLVKYGRNNLAYVTPFGSYAQILGYLTNADLPVKAGWAPTRPALLDRCRRCHACEAVCPTGAIQRSRVLIAAERCLTLATESPGAWPPWVPQAAHHCLIGCLRCQRVCPANGTLPTASSGVAFTEEETSALLDGDPERCRWCTSLAPKLEAIVGPGEREVIGRNLRALLAARGVSRCDERERAR
jgi:epoxyqueuosine reductase